MNRRKFLGVAGGSIVTVGGLSYLLSDKNNFTRTNVQDAASTKSILRQDEREILYLASLAPSGHNAQPWFVKYLEPYHWIICNDKGKWLPAVDPTQRETLLSIGAFMQNLEYAAGNAGYNCEITILAKVNQDENIAEVKLTKSISRLSYDITKIKNRRTVRANFLNDALKKEDIEYMDIDQQDFFHFIPNSSKEYSLLNGQTIEANRIQAYRDAAQRELSEWIRFSSKDAENYLDGLTTASLDLEGIPGWVVRNFYSKSSVMTTKFRNLGIDTAKSQVAKSAGWLLITSNDNLVTTLLETGRRLQRLLLKVRDKNIAIHPMSQILEESVPKEEVCRSIGISNIIQFILRLGYVKVYPDPVSLRRPVDWFVRSGNT